MMERRSDGGWTEFAYLRWNFQTKNRMRLYTDFPNQWSGRANGGTFVFKGDMAALNGSYVMEGVACPRSTPYERMESACQWVHTPVAATAAQISSIRDTWGYTSMNGAGNRGATPQICTEGNIFGRGGNFTQCSRYSHGGNPAPSPLYRSRVPSSPLPLVRVAGHSSHHLTKRIVACLACTVPSFTRPRPPHNSGLAAGRQLGGELLGRAGLVLLEQRRLWELPGRGLARQLVRHDVGPLSLSSTPASFLLVENVRGSPSSNVPGSATEKH